jgi:hypothetical protein
VMMRRRRRGNKVHMTTNCVNIYLNNRTDKSREYRVLINMIVSSPHWGKKTKSSLTRVCITKAFTDAAGSLLCFLLLRTHARTHVTCNPVLKKYYLHGGTMTTTTGYLKKIQSLHSRRKKYLWSAGGKDASPNHLSSHYFSVWQLISFATLTCVSSCKKSSNIHVPPKNNNENDR